MAEFTPQVLTERLLPRIDISELEKETDAEKINAVVFELYKETWSVVDVAAHILDEVASSKGGWPRDQAICAGLLVRITKFMLVVTQLSAKGDRLEVVDSLNRSIMESSINLEFLVRKNESKFFDQFVTSSLGSERELHDLIQANIAARNGEVWPIERRMLESIDYTCQISGVQIADVTQKYFEWGGGLRERLKFLGKEERYVLMQRIPSHAVHGTWVDLHKNHLDFDSTSKTFSPDNRFSWVDARALGPVAVIVLEAAETYVDRFFSAMDGIKPLLERMHDLINRLKVADRAHEKVLGD